MKVSIVKELAWLAHVSIALYQSEMAATLEVSMIMALVEHCQVDRRWSVLFAHDLKKLEIEWHSMRALPTETDDIKPRTACLLA
jgi:hypothetical protein